MALAGWLLVAVAAAAGNAEAPRVAAARRARGESVRSMFAAAGVPYPPPVLYLRAFKREAVLELWAGRRDSALALVKSYPVCASSGELGPKRREGDGQVPEGFYAVDRFNPASNFHLSLGLDYPNASDRVLADRRHPGGDVFIHGDCVTIGCIPIEDGPIEEVYLAAWDAWRAGLRRLPVHVFPARMDGAGLAWLEQRAGDDAGLRAFWASLAPAYRHFEQRRRVPRVDVLPATGAYRLRGDAP